VHSAGRSGNERCAFNDAKTFQKSVHDIPFIVFLPALTGTWFEFPRSRRPKARMRAALLLLVGSAMPSTCRRISGELA
jgi:hypothetical protein